MASYNNGGSGGIPRLLYSESVHQPLLVNDGNQYGSGSGQSSSRGGLEGASDDSRPRRFTAALNAYQKTEGSRASEDETPPDPFASPAVDESGTMINPRQVVNRSNEVPGFHEFVPYTRDSDRTKYEEAALFVIEGEENTKFASHPNGKYSKLAYHIFHNPFFYLLDFVASCLLLALAIVEQPSLIPYPANHQPIVTGILSVLELVFLTIIGSNIMMRLIWMKPKTFLRQRAMIAFVVLIVMYIEAMVILFRRQSHFRITRCLRIIFFIDTYILVGVRRVLRQIFKCLKPIIDVLILLFFMMAIFALMGYYLFATTDPTFFDSYLKAFVSLFITLTTANHPDVYMEAYYSNHFSPLFFIVYLFVTLYFFSNVLLAVVYANFNDEEKDKFKKLFLHKREALKLAFYVLAKEGEGINYHDFLLFMLNYKPRIPEYQVMCIFKALQSEPHENLSLEEFLNFYEMQNLKWKQTKGDGRVKGWYDDFPKKVRPFFAILHKIVRFRYFNSIMAVVVIFNALFLMLFTLITSFYCGNDGANDVKKLNLTNYYCGDDRFIASHDAIYGSFVFTFVYLVEIVVRLLAVGPIDYFKKWWNRFDFVVIVLSVILLCIEADAGSTHLTLRYLIVFRPIKLLRLLRLRRRYYDIMNTVFILGHRLLSVLLLLFVLYYFYAIIGMEVFAGKVFVGCCNKALYGVGAYYSSNGTPPSNEVYWLNNFNNIYQSYVILYEEMVVNNWFVQMEGFVSETNIAARIYFFSFWCVTTVCLSVVIAYIVDAFVFRIQTDKTKKKCEIHSNLFECNCIHYRKKCVDVVLAGSEINKIKYEMTLLDETRRSRKRSKFNFNFTIRNLRRIDFDLIPSRVVAFSGKRLRTKEDLNLEMYRSELQNWINDREEQLNLLRQTPHKKQSLKETLWKKTKELLLYLLE